jgi:hypothetical protein
MTPAHWAAHRARGMAWLVAPLSAAGVSLAGIRVFLMVLSAILLFTAFALWVPLIGAVAPLAAVLYGGTWLALFYGAEVMPNHFTALFALITVGAYVRRRSGGAVYWNVVAVAAMATTALLRPTDASTLFAGLVVVELLVNRGRAWRDLVPLTAGLAVGWGQWLWEAETRFAGVVARFHRASELAGGVGFDVVAQLRAADGPLLGGDRYTSPACVLWWLGLFSLSLYGALRPSLRRTTAVVAVAAGLASTVTYFFFIRGTQTGTWAPVISPRFLCPAYALLAIPAAVGCVTLLHGIGKRSRAIAVLSAVTLAAVIGLWQVWQWQVAERIATRQYAVRESQRVTARAIRRLRQDRPCLLISQFPEPQVRFSSGCREAHRKPYVFRRSEGLADLKRQGEQRFVLVHPPPYANGALAMRGWRVVRPPGTHNILLFVEPVAEGVNAEAPPSSRADSAPPAKPPRPPAPRR